MWHPYCCLRWFLSAVKCQQGRRSVRGAANVNVAGMGGKWRRLVEAHALEHPCAWSPPTPPTPPPLVCGLASDPPMPGSHRVSIAVGPRGPMRMRNYPYTPEQLSRVTAST
eukprot:354921-Chlamydomonas_euryale.AAC.3